MSAGKTKLVIAVLALGIAVRIFFFVWGYINLPVSSDEAWVGLMSAHIMKGEYPVVYWGQSYMGTQESYIDAPLIKIFGLNAFSLRIYPFIFSLLFMWVTYRLACKVYNRDVGLITLLLLAVPVPYLTIPSALIVPDNYIATCFWGTLGLLVSYDLIFLEDVKRKALRFALLGFVLGFGFWLHILIVSYIGVIVLFLFLKDKRLVIRKDFWIFAASFLAGCLPLAAYNVTHHFATFRDVAMPTDLAHTIENVKLFFGYTSHFLLGMKVMLYGDNPNFADLPRVLYLFIGWASLGLIVLVFIAEFKKMWRVAILSLKNVNGTAFLFVMAAAAVFVFARSSRTNSWSVRYVLPIMSVIPVLLACGLWKIKKISRLAFYALIAGFIFSTGWGNYLLAKAWDDPQVVSEQLDLPDTKPLIDFLDRHSIKHAYAHFWISFRLTCETKEKIICAMPYNERYGGYEVPFLQEVRKAGRVAYITHKKLGLPPVFFEESLRLAGCGYKKEAIDSFMVFYDFTPKSSLKGEELQSLREIPRGGWKVDSNYRKEDAVLALDGSVATRWGSGAPQAPGMYYYIDLGNEYDVAKIDIRMGGFIKDFPRGYRVDMSPDGKGWTSAAEVAKSEGIFWKGTHPVIFPEEFSIFVMPQRARFVKITQTGSASIMDWSIAELHIFERVSN